LIPADHDPKPNLTRGEIRRAELLRELVDPLLSPRLNPATPDDPS
jgi:hypothetical protein